VTLEIGVISSFSRRNWYKTRSFLDGQSGTQTLFAAFAARPTLSPFVLRRRCSAAQEIGVEGGKSSGEEADGGIGGSPSSPDGDRVDNTDGGGPAGGSSFISAVTSTASTALTSNSPSNLNLLDQVRAY